MSKECLWKVVDCLSCGWLWSCNDIPNKNFKNRIRGKICSLNPSLAIDNFSSIAATLGVSREEIVPNCPRTTSLSSLSPTYSIDRLVPDKHGSQCSLVSNGPPYVQNTVNQSPVGDYRSSIYKKPKFAASRASWSSSIGGPGVHRSWKENRGKKSRAYSAHSDVEEKNKRNADQSNLDDVPNYQQTFGEVLSALRLSLKTFTERPKSEVPNLVTRRHSRMTSRSVRARMTRSWYADVDPNSSLESSDVVDYIEEQLKDEIAEVAAEMESHETGDESKSNPKTKQLSIGRKKFNMDSKKGIEYLIENGLLQNTPNDIAQFLYKGEGLNKTAIGDYLGERNDFNQQVLEAFVSLHDFTDLILVQALRQFLWSFRLPGEAQKIDRMMECFARRYCELNPSIFKHPDTCFVLSFAIIMLNTSLHNPAVKEKQTLDQFKNMNRGIDNGDDLPSELLASLYESIKTEPFKIPEDDGNDLMHTFFNPDREGWLWKQGGRYKSWKRRWFILNDNCLYYFEYTTDKEPRGIIPLENIEVRDVHDRNKPHCFELYATSTELIKACKTDSEGKVVEGKHTVYRMSAHSQEEKDDWVKCIRQSISHNPFYDLLAKRKKNIQKNAS